MLIDPIAASRPADPDSTSVPPVSHPRDEPLHQRFTVAWEYPLHFTRGLFRPGNPVLRSALSRRESDRRHRCLFLIDGGVAEGWPDLPQRIAAYAAAHADAMQVTRPPVVLPGGEAAKNDATLPDTVLRMIEQDAIDRQSFVVCIGGGALLDAVGYAAAIAHRGVRLIRVPTTVLAQNDSGVGVKNGVNAFGKKNFLGTFAPPFAVLNDLELLASLNRRDWISGMSEAVKVALIRDIDFFRWMERDADRLAACETGAVEHLIRRCAELHLAHIAGSGDPFEFGSARPLDFGHWAAHKLESLTAHQLRHGEAVAIGVALDTVYSAEAGHLDRTAAARVVRLLERIGFRLWDDALDRADADGRPGLLRGVQEFREHLGGELSVTLLRAIGVGFEAHTLDEPRIRAALAWLRARDAARHVARCA